MGSIVRLGLYGIIAVLAAIAANWARDVAFMVNALVVLAVAAGLFLWTIARWDVARRMPNGAAAPAQGYMDDVIRAGVIATAVWGVVGFLVGVVIAFQLAFPELNLGLPWTSFGRLRPLHTSAVIFAFGGTALIATSFYVVQRTCATRLWGGNLAWFVFWGYQLVIVLAATAYVFGGSQSREYAEPARRRLALGRRAGGDPLHGRPRHPLRRRPGHPLLGDAGLRRRRHPERRADRRGCGLRALALDGGGGG